MTTAKTKMADRLALAEERSSRVRDFVEESRGCQVSGNDQQGIIRQISQTPHSEVSSTRPLKPSATRQRQRVRIDKNVPEGTGPELKWLGWIVFHKRRILSVMLPGTAVAIIWVAIMVSQDKWSDFGEGWPMTATMVFGAFIAGSTPQGGGAVAFPVLTLALDLEPVVAKDFSIAIQSVGMVCATFTMVILKASFEKNTLLYAGGGGILGVISGAEVIAGKIPPPYVKMLFTSLWLAFGVSLFLLRRVASRETHSQIVNLLPDTKLVLIFFGFIGGILTSLAGAGFDTLLFAVLVLLFRVKEGVAQRTSVALMASNSVVLFLFEVLVQQNFESKVWPYWLSAAPIVAFMAPIGLLYAYTSDTSKVTQLLYVSIFAQFIAALFIVHQTPWLLAFTAAIFVFGTLLFKFLSVYGQKRNIWNWVAFSGVGSSSQASGVSGMSGMSDAEADRHARHMDHDNDFDEDDDNGDSDAPPGMNTNMNVRAKRHSLDDFNIDPFDKSSPIVKRRDAGYSPGLKPSLKGSSTAMSPVVRSALRKPGNVGNVADININASPGTPRRTSRNSPGPGRMTSVSSNNNGNVRNTKNSKGESNLKPSSSAVEDVEIQVEDSGAEEEEEYNFYDA